MNSEDAFDEWFKHYFVDTQGEEKPNPFHKIAFLEAFTYQDVRIAFLKGWKEGRKEERK